MTGLMPALLAALAAIPATLMALHACKGLRL